ncbi:Ig-like domain-containing protein [Streptomyces sp. MTZ3.1]|uniref:Ig-like domain-containing protein n=2 Tax=Streptomyces meridianus TaxID=2938945 RepID=A0ABT0X6Y8_9ACTN|nr:Ig-like domain-containing protein [Streptomyces meridianus]MCM2578100.1 Ig-like domain-containing protein [Streptomyces meridianus]
MQPISGTPGWWRCRRGSRTGAALLIGAVLLGVTACGGGADAADGSGRNGGKGGEVDTRPSRAELKIAPKDGAKGVDTSGEFEVTVTKGRLTSVEVADSDGKAVDGRITKGGTVWKPSRHLQTSTKYTVDAVAKDADGRRAAEHASFTTLDPKATFIGYFTPEDGSEVGVGMPVSIRFSRGITDPGAVEKGIEVTASPSVPIEGHWFGNDRLDFRPEEYWKPGTKVTLKLALDGVEGRPGVYGKQAKTVKFTIGRSQVSVVDAKSKKMTVERDGKVIKKIPITSGSPSNPTYNGQMVISEKYRVTRMNGETVGFDDEYDIKDVPHAMRLSTSGTFIHGNYWAGQWTFGRQNASHGCVGLFDARGGGDKSTPAAWFFRNSMIGDVVEVKNSKDKKIQPDNGLNGWNMDWDEWKADQ